MVFLFIALLIYFLHEGLDMQDWTSIVGMLDVPV